MENIKKHNDSQVLELSKRDPRFFEHIYNRYKSRVFSFFYRRLGSKEVAWDLTQETLTKAFYSRHRFNYKGYPYSAYIFRIAHNLLVNYYKKKKPVSLESIKKDPYFTPSYYDKIEGDMVWTSIDKLSHIERTVLYERYKKGLTIREIAHRVNKSENAVKLILSRSRKKLRKKYFSEK